MTERRKDVLAVRRRGGWRGRRAKHMECEGKRKREGKGKGRKWEEGLEVDEGRRIKWKEGKEEEIGRRREWEKKRDQKGRGRG